MKLVILDRDGVINEDSDDYIKSADEWIPIEGSIQAIADLCRAGYQVTIATNQSGIGRGYFDLDDLEAMHAKLCSLVEDAGGSIAGIFYCPHTPEDECDCRKPKAGLFDAIAAEFECDLNGVPAIGDSLRDIQAAQTKGCNAMLVKTGKGQRMLERHANELTNIPVFENLQQAANTLLS